MAIGICKLCDEEGELQHSHVIPAFAYRWLRETSGTGHIRLGAEPNRRIQDGKKLYWLCANCELRLGKSETAFAKNLFHPFSSGKEARFIYGPWLMQFCVSVSWRVLRYYREETDLEGYSDQSLERLSEADRIWKEVLLGQRAHPGHCRQHLIPLDAIESATGKLAPNINRYLMRVIEMDVVRGSDTEFVFSKIGSSGEFVGRS